MKHTTDVPMKRDRWLPLMKVAKLVNISCHRIRQIMRKQGSFASKPPIVFRKEPGARGYELPLQATYEYLKAHCKQAKKQLVNPSTAKTSATAKETGSDEPQHVVTPCTTLAEIKAAMFELTKRRFGSEEISKLSQLAQAVRQIEKAEADRAEWITLEDHHAKCDKVAAAWAGAVYEQSKAVATEAIAKFKKDTGIDLDGLNVSSRDILAAALCRSVNEVVKPAVRKALGEIR